VNDERCNATNLAVRKRANRTASSLPVADDGVELDDGLLLLGGEWPPLDVRPEVVGPPQPAALAAPAQTCMQTVQNVMRAIYAEQGGRKPKKRQTCELGEHAPAPVAVGLDVVDEELVLLRRPRALLEPLIHVAARRPPHRQPSA
jgi:hypothetical protein